MGFLKKIGKGIEKGVKTTGKTLERVHNASTFSSTKDPNRRKGKRK
jgi:hypothetical protein